MTTPLFTPKHPENSEMYRFMKFSEQVCGVSFKDYAALHAWSVSQPAQFWETLAQFFHISFDTPPTHILNTYTHPLEARWFEGAAFNFAKILLKREDDHPAIISFNELHEKQVISFQDLQKQVIQVAEGLIHLGITSGDRVAAVLPNIPETVILMLATSAIGAIFSSCSPDFGAAAALDRLGQISPKLLVICHEYTYQGKIHQTASKARILAKNMPSLKALVIVPYLQPIHALPDIKGLDVLSWNDLQRPHATFVFKPFPFHHPLYILFSSGTTGKPKCILHGAGGTLLQHMKELGLHTDLKPTDNLFFYTTCGWMMWNWMASALALGTTLTLYEGSPLYPSPFRLFQIMEEAEVSVFGTSAKYISTLQKLKIFPHAVKIHRS